MRGTGGDSRMLARLVSVATRVEQAKNRGRARTVLRKWSEQAKEARRQAQIERCFFPTGVYLFHVDFAVIFVSVRDC